MLNPQPPDIQKNSSTLSNRLVHINAETNNASLIAPSNSKNCCHSILLFFKPKKKTKSSVRRSRTDIFFSQEIKIDKTGKEKPEWQLKMSSNFLELFKFYKYSWIEKTLEFLADYSGPATISYMLTSQGLNSPSFPDKASKEYSVFELQTHRNAKLESIKLLQPIESPEPGSNQKSRKTILKLGKNNQNEQAFQLDLLKKKGTTAFKRLSSNFSGVSAFSIMVKEKARNGSKLEFQRILSGRLKESRTSGSETLDIFRLNSPGRNSIDSVDQGRVHQYLHHEENYIGPQSPARLQRGQSRFKRVKTSLKLFHKMLNSKNSFFYNLQKRIVQYLYLDFVCVKRLMETHRDEEGIAQTLDSLFINSILYSKELSKGAFQMFLQNEILQKGDEGDLDQSEIFLTTIISFAFSKSIISVPSVKKKSGVEIKSLHDLIAPMLLTQHQSSIIRFKLGLKKLIKREVLIEDLHPLLELSGRSVREAERLSSGGVKPPEFVIEIARIEAVGGGKKLPRRFTESFGSKNKKISYRESLDALRKISKEKSPYFKLFYFLKCIRSISVDIDEFYADYGYSASIVLTAEELFPILIVLLMRCGCEGDFLKDLIITSTFLTEEMQAGEVGHCLNTFFAVHEYVCQLGDF